MGFKDLLKSNPFKKDDKGRRSRPEDRELTAEDLIVLERYDEAEAKLKARLKKDREDLHAHLKLGEVYLQQKRAEDAVQEYVYVAEEYARDGFYDKGVALLSKISRLMPANETLRLKEETLRLAKRRESKREAAVEGMREGGASGGAWAMEVQRCWHELADSSLIRDLTEDQLKRLTSAMTLSRWSEGMAVVERGETTEELYLVLSGVLEARLIGSPSPGSAAEAGAGGDAGEGEGSEAGAEPSLEGTTLRTFSGGDVVGEAALLERSPWPATYVATERTLLLGLSRLGLQKVLVGNPDPKGLLDALRRQGNDKEVAKLIYSLG